MTQQTVVAVGGQKLFQEVEWEVLLCFSLTFPIYLETMTLLHLVHFSRTNKQTSDYTLEGNVRLYYYYLQMMCDFEFPVLHFQKFYNKILLTFLFFTINCVSCT